MNIARVFPRRTKATPDDDMAFVGDPPLFFPREPDEIHISVTWTYDIPEAERLERSWRRIGVPVRVGGPATWERGEEFTPGMYVKRGYVITSRGCPNKCWFCSVWKREGQEIRELPVTQGYNLLDDNILACSDEHIQQVFYMLKRGAKTFKRPVELTGGLEAAILTDKHVSMLRELRPKQMFFAYDGPEDREPLAEAGKRLLDAGWTRASHTLRAYVLIGYPKDTFDAADKRLLECLEFGFIPMAMLWKNDKGEESPGWRKFQRAWARPALIAAKKGV